MKEQIIQEVGQEAYEFIKKNTDLERDHSLLLSTSTSFNLDCQPFINYNFIINLKRINDIRYINKFFESVNSKLKKGGIFISFAETYFLRKKRILAKYPPVFNYIYYSFDWIFKRLFPKLRLTKKIYFLLTRGENRVISKAETLGRLYSCGFEIIDERQINNYFYFVVKKVSEPMFNNNPTYGPFISLDRIGKNGKSIKVYKIRTMHPYSEYIQKYIYELNGSSNGDKANNDFRVTTLGYFFRRFWIDELPMIINLIKGDMKIVGFRPLSEIKFKMYPIEYQKIRIKYKPGLIPPFYVDLPESFEDLVKSEITYLNSYQKNPCLTDMKYFFYALYNILFKNARSK